MIPFASMRAFSRELGVTKEADFDEIKSLFSKYAPELAGAGVGAGLGAGAGWATTDPKTRARKTFVGGILGAILGGGATHLGRRISSASGAVEQAAKSLGSAGESARKVIERTPQVEPYTASDVATALSDLQQRGISLPW